MSVQWGPNATTKTAGGRTNAEYLAWVTATVADHKQKLIDVLDLQPGMAVLDAGCGIGDDAIVMAERVGPAGRVVGFDHSETLLDEARAKAHGLEPPLAFVKGDIYDMPFADNTFDVVRSDRVFQHLSDTEAATRELCRITRPGGIVSLNDQDPDGGIFDCPDRDLYRRIRHAISDHQIANGFAGRTLYRHLKAEGMDINHVDIYAVPVLSLELADAFVNASGWGRRAHEHGAIRADEVVAWERHLTELDAAGQFFASGIMIHVIGRKPM